MGGVVCFDHWASPLGGFRPLGFAKPEEKYHEYVKNLKIMLGHYHTVVTSLTPSNEELLRGKLYHLGPS